MTHYRWMSRGKKVESGAVSAITAAPVGFGVAKGVVLAKFGLSALGLLPVVAAVAGGIALHQCMINRP